ncbi:PKD domain-containing protein [uncultured Methanolobus sp.]|uniref:PKD domain-containing protein n=1 Tax=uncultured Methanolobus sp. TaxID=218300 RepID=UPI002AAB83BE|nr:PKD domain-containing protein [uncultured Methanolobus sp.]
MKQNMIKHGIMISMILLLMLSLVGVVSAHNVTVPYSGDSGSSSVKDVPAADFTADVTSGTAPFTVNFTDQSTGAASWSWDFDGDGIEDSAEQNPQYIFYPGNYTVNLTVSNSAGSDTESKEDYIGVIGPYSTAMANENPGAPDPAIPMYIGPEGDGKYDTSSDDNINYRNPIFVARHTSVVDYSPSAEISGGTLSLGDLTEEEIAAGKSPGEITVWFEAPICNGKGTDFVSTENAFLADSTGLLFAELGYLEVSTDGEYFARFPSVSYTSGRVGDYGGIDSRNVYNLVGKHVSMYGNYWGTPFDLDDLADDPGVLNGSLDLNEINYVRVIDIPGSGHFKDSLGNPIYDAWPTWGTGGLEFGGIDVIYCRPAANFTADETTGSGSLTVQFTDISTGGPTTWLWDFGDGNTSNEQNPVHAYTTEGTYTVSLKATNQFGNDSEVKDGYIIIDYKDPRSPVVEFTADPVSGAFPLTVQFTDASTGEPTDWLWDFGDGSTSTEQNPLHVYADPGVYVVKLTAMNEFGSSYLVKTDYISSYGILADTSWPKFRMDAKNSGISPYIGPQTNNTVWNITTDASFGYSSSLSIGSDGTIYFGGGYYDYNVYAMNPDGTVKWNYTVGKSVYSTTISSDGTIYFGCTDKNCYALNPDGTLKWSYTTDSYLAASPAIGSDGTIYFGGQSDGTGGTVYAMNPDGTLKWSYTDEDAGVSPACPAIGSDGTIYVPFQDGTVCALNPNGTEKWNFSTGGRIESSPVLDSDDTLYVGNRAGKVFAINPDGTEKWNYAVGGVVGMLGGFMYSSPIVGTDGTVYIGAYALGNFYALNPNGTLKWSCIDNGAFSGSPIIDANGIIYICNRNDKTLYAINPDGTIKWTYATGPSVTSTPALSEDGTLYIATDIVYDSHGDVIANGGIYAFCDPAKPPVASFISDITSGDVPLPVSFTDTSERAESWSWDFDSDGVVDSTEQNPKHTYVTPGTYTVTLTVSNTGGSDTVVIGDCITVLEAPASSPADEDTWYQFMKTAGHTGYSGSDAPDTNTLLWRSSKLTDDFTLVPSSSVAVADGKVFANAIIGPVDEDGNPEDGAVGQLVAFSMYNGRVYWNTTIAVPELGSWSSPAYDNGYVFTSTGANTTCINASTGAIKWIFTNPSNRASCNGGPVIAEGKVLCSDWDGLHYYCLDEATGTKLWNYTVDSSGSYTQGTPAISDGKIILTSWTDIYCLDMDGNLLWTKTSPSLGNICGSPSIAGELFYLTTYNFGSDDYPALFAFYLENGTLAWNSTIQRSDSTPTIVDGYLYVSGGAYVYSESQTYCFDALNGTLIWNTTKSDDGVGDWTCSIAVADGKAFVGKSAGSSFGHTGLYALNTATGKEVWHSDYAGDSPAIAADTVFSIGKESDGVSYLYAFKDDKSATPVADFSADVTEGIGPLTVQFNDLSTGAESWAWDFDNDGVVDSNKPNPQFIYTEKGTHSVKLTVTNSAGSSSELKVDYISVTYPSPDFIANVTEGTAPLTLEFTGNVSGLAPEYQNMWSWDVDGDGIYDYSPNFSITHTYTEPGTYTVIAKYDGWTPNVKTDYITVLSPMPVAKFSADVVSGTAPLTVNFTDQSTDAANWSWDFNCDGVVDSTEQNPQYTYTSAGEYSVNLTVTNSYGSDFEMKTDYITVSSGGSAGDAPVADFSADVTSGEASLTVCFTDTSTDAESWSWDFDGDGVADSIEQNPQFTYNEAGSFTVTLTVGNSAGDATETKTGYITVGESVEGWTSFQKDTSNSGITANAGPIISPDLNNSWNVFTHASSSSGIDTVPLVVNDSVYVFTTGGHVLAFNHTTGTLKWESIIPECSGFQVANPAYGNDKLFVPTADSRIFAFDALTGKELWNDSVETNSEYGQLNTPVIYDNGRIYFGQWVSYGSPGKYYCYTEDGIEVWNRDCTHGNKGYYWAGATVINDYLIFGGDDGYLISLYKTNGSLVDELDTDAGMIRSSVVYEEESGRLFTSTKNGYCISIKVNSDGTFNASSLLKSNALGLQSTSTPVIYNGRVYLGSGNSQASGPFLCLNSTDLVEIWRFTGTNGGIQSSPVISTAYDDGDGEVYIYFTTNTDSGRLYCLKDTATNYQMDSEEWYFEPESEKNEYTLQGVALVDGWLYYGNDAGYLFGLKAESNGSVPDSPVISFNSESTSVIEGQTIEIVVSIDYLPDGLSGYYLTMDIDDPAIAEIVGIEYPDWATLNDNSSLPGTSIYMKAADLYRTVDAGAEDVVLATLTVAGKEPGSANFTLDISRLENDIGSQINATLEIGTLEVTRTPIPGQTASPRDLDGDGLYEDLTGDGVCSFVDVEVLFYQMDWIEANMPSKVDYNGNGRVDFDDVVALFDMV